MLGYKPWKEQKIDTSRGPPTDYTKLSLPLPTPPAGMKWERDLQTREWALVPRNVSNQSRTNSQPVQQQLQEEGEEKETNSDHDHDSSHPLEEKEEEEKKEKTKDPSKEYPNLAFFQNSDDKMIAGVDYLEHTVLPTDTFQGICLSYKISALKLRQTNQFSGTTLTLAPSKLIIPLRGHPNKDQIRKQDPNSPEFKIQTMRAEFPSLGEKEVKSYLEIVDWNVGDAIADAREDLRWERSNTALWTVQQKYAESHGMPTLPVKTNWLKRAEAAEAVTTSPRLDVHTAVPLQHFVEDKEEETASSTTESKSGIDVELSPLMTPLLSNTNA